MIISATKATKIPFSGGEVWDYPLPTEVIGIALQKLTDRGPRKGYYLNTVCHEIYFIISGTAQFSLRETTYEVKEKDVIIVEPNTPHAIQAQNLVYITITRPNWYEEQYREVKSL